MCISITFRLNLIDFSNSLPFFRYWVSRNNCKSWTMEENLNKISIFMRIPIQILSFFPFFLITSNFNSSSAVCSFWTLCHKNPINQSALIILPKQLLLHYFVDLLLYVDIILYLKSNENFPNEILYWKCKNFIKLKTLTK